jgi:hypothetical protein
VGTVLHRLGIREFQGGAFKFGAGTEFADFLMKSEEDPDAADFHSPALV